MSKLKSTFDYELKTNDSKLLHRFMNFAVTPFYWGMFVFAIFFSVILITKLIFYFLSEKSIFSLNIYDVLFSLIGFGFGFIIEFTIKMRKELLK